MSKKNHRFIYLLLSSLLLLNGCGGNFSLKREEVNTSTPWSYFRGDIHATGDVAQSDFNGKLDVVWEFKTNDKPVGPLTITDGYLVYPGSRNRIKFIRTKNGKYAGKLKPKGTPQTGLMISDSLAYFAVAPIKNKLKCINLLNRKTVWQKQVKDAAVGSIIVKENLIIGSAEGRLFAFDKTTGDVTWVFNSDSRFTVPAVFGNDKIWQPGDDGLLYIIDPEDGKEISRVQLDAPIGSSVAYAQSIYAADISGMVYKIDADDGQILWRKNVGGPVWGAVAVSGDRLYVGQSGGEVVSLSTEDGMILWRYRVENVIIASVLSVGDFIVFGTKKGFLYSLNASDGSLVDKRELNGPLTTAPVSDGNRVYIATDKGMITCFGERDETN